MLSRRVRAAVSCLMSISCFLSIVNLIVCFMIVLWCQKADLLTNRGIFLRSAHQVSSSHSVFVIVLQSQSALFP
jgi:hypothetical protein